MSKSNELIFVNRIYKSRNFEKFSLCLRFVEFQRKSYTALPLFSQKMGLPFRLV